MVSERVRIDPDAMAAVGSTLAGVAQRMADDLAVLETTVTGSGNPWGDDESGTVFAVAYQAVLGHALGALGSYVEQVGTAAVALTVQAREMAAVDDAAAAGLSSFTGVAWGGSGAASGAGSGGGSASGPGSGGRGSASGAVSP